jgi:ubiquinone biosynthesis protein Coq4
MSRIGRALAERAHRAALFVRTLWGGLRLLLDPSRLNDVFVLERGTLDAASGERILAALRADRGVASAIDARARIGEVDLERLRALPEGTLGRAFADFLGARGLDPRSIPRLEAPDDATFVRAHLYETHDIWHVVTGFDTDVAGELGLQAFYSAQVDGNLPRWLLAGGLLQSVLKEPEDWSRRLEAVARGWRRGKEAKPLFGARWDQLWDRPLDEVRASFALA